MHYAQTESNRVAYTKSSPNPMRKEVTICIEIKVQVEVDKEIFDKLMSYYKLWRRITHEHWCCRRYWRSSPIWKMWFVIRIPQTSDIVGPANQWYSRSVIRRISDFADPYVHRSVISQACDIAGPQTRRGPSSSYPVESAAVQFLDPRSPSLGFYAAKVKLWCPKGLDSYVV